MEVLSLLWTRILFYHSSPKFWNCWSHSLLLKNCICLTWMLESTALKYKAGVILHSSFEAAAGRQSSPKSKVTVNLGDNSLNIRQQLKICFSNQSTWHSALCLWLGTQPSSKNCDDQHQIFWTGESGLQGQDNGTLTQGISFCKIKVWYVCMSTGYHTHGFLKRFAVWLLRMMVRLPVSMILLENEGL